VFGFLTDFEAYLTIQSWLTTGNWRLHLQKKILLPLLL